jgi:hypothetical protein
MRSLKRVQVIYKGNVQGVGFRFTAMNIAVNLLYEAGLLIYMHTVRLIPLGSNFLAIPLNRYVNLTPKIKIHLKIVTIFKLDPHPFRPILIPKYQISCLILVL